MTSPAPLVIGPGLHKGLPYDEYARIDAASHSLLRHFNRTAAHAREAIVNPADSTPAQEFGAACHLAILEPHLFEAQCVPAPKFDKRTRVGKLGWEEFKGVHGNHLILPQDEYDQALRMRDAVWQHPTAAELLKGQGFNEVSAVWMDGETGLMAKARIDRLTTLADWSIVVDLKTTRDAGRKHFERDVYTLRYHQQAAYYVDGLAALKPHDRKFMFIAVEKEPPYLPAVYELEDVALEQGRDEYRRNLRAYAECLATNRWQGYPDGADLVGLPAWAYKGFETEV